MLIGSLFTLSKYKVFIFSCQSCQNLVLFHQMLQPAEMQTVMAQPMRDALLLAELHYTGILLVLMLSIANGSLVLDIGSQA